MEDLLQVGVITATHGLRGEMKVFPTTSDPARFKKLKQCILDTGKERKELTIESCKFFKQFVILKFKEFSSINDVEVYKRCPLFVTREHAIKLKKNEYFVADLIDCQVEDENAVHLGTLVDVLETGANDVYIVKTPDQKEILIPAIKECILSVDIEKKQIVVHLLKGLVEE